MIPLLRFTVAFAWLPAMFCSSITNAAKIEEARRALREGAIDRAASIYKSIPYGDREWPVKLEDGIRWQILQGNFREAWRMAEMAQRLNLAMGPSGYYRKLSAIRAGACALSIDARPLAWDYLLAAHIFRFVSRYRQPAEQGSSFDQVSHQRNRPTVLIGAMVHYLRDIPKARLIRGSGCRFAHFLMDDDPEENRLRELRYLASFLEDQEQVALSGREGVVLRYLQLVQRRQRRGDPLDERNELLADRLIERYESLSAKGWAAMQEPFRRVLWDVMIKAEKFPSFPIDPEKSKNVEKTLERIIYDRRDPDVAYWLGGINFDRWEEERRQRMLEYLLTIPELAHRDHLLMRRAILYHQAGQMEQALVLLRRLLKGDESVTPEVREAAVLLALEIFREHRFDEPMLGAIQAALPTSLWKQVLRAIIIEQALIGDRQGYRRLTHYAKRVGVSSDGALWDPIASQLLKAMAHRNGKEFGDIVRRLEKGGGRHRHRQRILTQIAERSLALSVEEYRSVQPFLRRLATMLTKQLGRRQGNREIMEMIHIFDRENQLPWQQGAAASKGGTTTVGAIDLSQPEALHYPYKPTSPGSVPLQPLVVVPDSMDGRGWVIR